MAARENQGLQIAVMIFFFLVVLLAASTYYFFKQDKDAQSIIASLEKDVKDRKGAYENQYKLNTQYKSLLGFTDQDKWAAVETARGEDYEGYGEGLDKETMNYRTIVAHLHGEAKASNVNHAAAVAREDELRAELARLQSVSQERYAVIDRKLKTVTTDYAGARAKIRADVDRMVKENREYQNKLVAAQTKVDQVVAKGSQVRTEQGKIIARQKEINQGLQDKIARTEDKRFEHADGSVTYVDQADRIVRINLGSNDNLKVQTVFSIYSSDASNLTSAERKGSVEITRIMSPNLAEARILDDFVSNPIMPNDQIYSPVWQRGQQDGFALVGFMDLNDNGRSDRATVRQLVLRNGGKIDMELSDAGKVTGKLDPATKYIVVGERPSDTSNTRLLEQYSALTDRAREFGIEQMTLRKFTDMMGYYPEERTVPLGTGASPDDFKARPETPEGEPKFRSRKRPTSF